MTNIWKYSIIGFVTLLLLWVVIPRVTSWLGKINWKVYNEQLDSYIRNGSTKDQAIDKIQSLYQSRIQADAIVDGSLIMANAFRYQNK